MRRRPTRGGEITALVLAMPLLAVSFPDGSFKTLQADDDEAAEEVVLKVLELINLADYKDDFRLAYVTHTSLSLLKDNDVPVRILRDSAVGYPPRENDPRIMLLRVYDFEPDTPVTNEELERVLYDQTLFFWRQGLLVLEESDDVRMAAMDYKRAQRFESGKQVPSEEIMEQLMRPRMPEALCRQANVYKKIIAELQKEIGPVTYNTIPIPMFARGAVVFPACLMRRGRDTKTEIQTCIYIKHNQVTVMGRDGLLLSQFEFSSIVRFREEPPDFVLEVAESNNDSVFLLFTAQNSSSIIEIIIEYAARQLQWESR